MNYFVLDSLQLGSFTFLYPLPRTCSTIYCLVRCQILDPFFLKITFLHSIMQWDRLHVLPLPKRERNVSSDTFRPRFQGRNQHNAMSNKCHRAVSLRFPSLKVLIVLVLRNTSATTDPIIQKKTHNTHVQAEEIRMRQFVFMREMQVIIKGTKGEISE